MTLTTYTLWTLLVGVLVGFALIAITYSAYQQWWIFRYRRRHRTNRHRPGEQGRGQPRGPSTGRSSG